MEEKWFIKELQHWVDSDIGKPCDPDCLAEMHGWIARQLYDKNREELRRLHSFLSPLSAKLSRALTKMRTPLATIQAAEMPALSGMIRGILFIMEKDDPTYAVNTIHHGCAVLEVLMKEGGGVRLNEIREKWPGSDQPPSASTISRAISALEEAGFIQRSGATKGRKFHILDKAQRWDMLRKHSEDHSITTETKIFQKNTVSTSERSDTHFQDIFSQTGTLPIFGFARQASLISTPETYQENLPRMPVEMDPGDVFTNLVLEAVR